MKGNNLNSELCEMYEIAPGPRQNTSTWANM